MSGYCISLYKYMRIGENQQKKEQLLERRTAIIDERGGEEHKKFFAYGEFDRISFERVEKFSKFRDISKDARGWIGDRQTHLVFDIGEDACKDSIFYKDGNFYEYQNGKAVQSNRLFLGLTILQFKYSQKQKYPDMKELLHICKKRILESVAVEKDIDVKCAVLGTLGSYGLTIIWLADQYIDVLRMVTQVRSMGLTSEDRAIFLSAYTIFAQNHKVENSNWEQRKGQVEGEAILHLTLKEGLDKDIESTLRQWEAKNDELYHCSGEHDVFIHLESKKVFELFDQELNYNHVFFKKFVLQTNVQLCEVISEDSFGNQLGCICEAEENRNNACVKNATEQNGEKKSPILDLEKIQFTYRELRTKFKETFPHTAGMVDTLDMLYSDYISKISTVSNEMWVNSFSHQFSRIMECIAVFIDHLDGPVQGKKKTLDYISELLCSFERQISHIAESNNLVLGTPICQFRYSGQNNLTLYAYFGIIKNALQFVYENQMVSSQDEIVPLIVTEIVPIIQSKLFFDINSQSDENDKETKKAKIVTINLPMTALYNPVCYYPYLYHELFHYVVPKDRYIRNKVVGAIISIRILHSSFRDILCQRLSLEESPVMLNDFVEVCILKYIYNFVLRNYEVYFESDAGLGQGSLNYQKIDEYSSTAKEYEAEVLEKWIFWINEETNIKIKNNFMMAFIEYLLHQADNVKNDFLLWRENRGSKSVAKEIVEVEEKMNQFIDELAGIADNEEPEPASQSFRELMDILGDEVLEEAETLIEAIKEGMADTAMVALGNIDFAEYLLLFTKTKKDLLLSERAVGVQDVIRIGMVLEFIGEERRSDDDYMDLIDDSKEAFISMYIGLYYSGRKLREPSDKERWIEKAEAWFVQGQNCYREYGSRFRIYAALLRELIKGILVCKNDEESVKHHIIEDSKYWKEYAQTLKECGNYIRKNNLNTYPARWEEKHLFIEKRIFGQNMELIYRHQYQDGFEELDSKRETRIEKCRSEVYDKSMFQFKKLELVDQVHGEIPIVGFQKVKWEYSAESVKDLCVLITDIASWLEKASERVLGKKENPIWYRGQQSVDYKLCPTIMRYYKERKAKCNKGEKFSLASYLREEYEEFKFRADGMPETVERTGYTDSDYIALMQHYSVASNFLDWTEDALSALYFALEGFMDKKAEKTNQAAALYIFSPELYNYARKKMIEEYAKGDDTKTDIEKEVVNTTMQEGIPNLTASYNLSKYRMYQLGDEKNIYENSKPISAENGKSRKWVYYLPLAVYVSRLNKRIQAQSGIFLAYNIYTAPDNKDEFDYMSLEQIQENYLNNYKEDRDICPFLFKIDMKKEQRENIAKWVKALGMSKEKCYPELANIGERIMR